MFLAIGKTLDLPAHCGTTNSSKGKTLVRELLAKGSIWEIKTETGYHEYKRQVSL